MGKMAGRPGDIANFIGDFFQREIGKAGRFFFQQNVADWYRKDLSFSKTDVRMPRGFSIKCEGAGALTGWLRQQSSIFPWIFIEEEIRTALRENHLYPHLIFEGEVAGYIKVATTMAYVHDFRGLISIPPGCAYIYDTFTLPGHRNKGLGRVLLDWLLNYLNGLGYKDLWCHIPAWNRASVNLYAGCGFKKVCRVRYVRIAGFKFIIPAPEKIMALDAKYR